MPRPESGESQNDYMKRCVPEVKGEGKTQDQAVGKCLGMFRHYSGSESIIARIDKWINEATQTGGYQDIGVNSVCSDDDFPTGNILMGRPYDRREIKAPGGNYKNFFPRNEWQWDEYEKAKGMEFIKNYHPTLSDDEILKSQFGNRLFRYSRKKMSPVKHMAKLNVARGKDPEATLHGIENIEGDRGVSEGIIRKIDRILEATVVGEVGKAMATSDNCPKGQIWCPKCHACIDIKEKPGTGNPPQPACPHMYKSGEGMFSWEE